MRRAILYYTCNTHDPLIEEACRAQLQRARGDCALMAVSREPIPFGDWNLVVAELRSPLTMHKQILTGLKAMHEDVVYLAESDVLYHPSHFEYLPTDGLFHYNTNVWRIRYPDGHGAWTDDLQQVSGLCARRELLIEFYTRRIAQIEAEGFDRHYEPGRKQSCMRCETANWQSAWPNLDIRHGATLTRAKWSPDEFRNPRYARGWKETDEPIPDWGQVSGRLIEFLQERCDGGIA